MAECNSSKIEEAESNVRLVRLMQRVDDLTEMGSIEANKDIVAFVGPTKAGKSTLISCLLGNQLICKRDEDTKDTFIIKAPEVPGPKIGASGESETVEPESYPHVSDINYTMWDFAGFGDNKGTEQEIVNAISYQTILRLQNTVRFVLVAPCDLIKADNPLPFYSLLYELLQICPQIADSLCIVSTKGEKGNIKGLLKKARSLQFPTNNNNIDLINQSQKVIEKVLEKGTCIDFNAPILDEEIDEKPFTLPNKQQFIDCINKLNGVKVSDFPLLISDTAKKEIAELFTVSYQTMQREVDSTNSLIDKYIQKKIYEVLEAQDENGKKATAASKLAIFKQGKSTIIGVIEKSENFKGFFVQVQEAGIGIIESFAEGIEKFIFIEKLKNMYKLTDTEKSAQGESQFFKSIKEALIRAAENYSVLIKNSEAATKEEIRKEKEWQEHNDKVIKSLKEEIKSLQTNNNSILVGAVQLLANDVVTVVSIVEKTVKSVCVVS